MIRLFHGSNVAIVDIDLERSKRGKDFGKGFYMNADPSQAMAMARRTTRFLGEGEPTLSCFEIDFSEAERRGLNIKIFEGYTEDWAQFVVMNRRNKTDVPVHPYDIVIGPIADDTVGVQIRRFIMGYMSASQLVEELRFVGDNAVQYFFGTPRALELLKRIEL